MKNVIFTASESVEIPVKEESIPIQHYLRQPQRLAGAIADPKLMRQLSDTRYRVQMREINFMDIYHFQPTVILKVWSGSEGTIKLRSEACEIKGIEYINKRFKLKVQGQLVPVTINNQTLLQGQADLKVQVELPPLLWLTPQPLLQITGNRILKSVLQRIKQRLKTQLIADYQQWAHQTNAAASEAQLGNAYTG
ncbi:MAG: DUF1997 domain-containing protein [Jaaginema sp. PMC 1079.18]|nr:DUF1997 domain-containing protein [Jaaginema sp. PMC 1080.18]MEC4850486.1 DUF1997 domain-containing protein [Jaaginema sp. PMC 1079.18]MEC4867532.1 DUF1997 domain-containing protein [Jaaginema sp. PMC 1078.18]